LESSVGPDRKTIPYAIVDAKRDTPFTRDLELASLFVVAEARRGREPLSAMALLHYPLHVHRWEGGVFLVDLLGLNHASVKYQVIPDVDEFERALDAVSDDPAVFREALEEKGAHFSKFAGQKTLRINGLIVNPRKSGELGDLLENFCDLDAGDEPVVFKPVLKGGDVEGIISSIRSLRRDIRVDLERLERAKRSLTDALDIARKVVEEEIQNIREGSAKTLALLRKEYEKAKDRRRKTLRRDLQKIRKEYRRQATPLRGERTRLKRKLARRRKKLERTTAEKDAPAAENLSREIEEIEGKLREIDDAIKPLEAWRDAEVKRVQDQYKADLKVEENKIKEEASRSQREVQSKRKEISGLEAAARVVASRIDALIRSKKSRLKSVSKLRFEVEAETADLYIPFYIFQYGEKKFDFYPPVVASSARGFLSRFRRMLADNLQSKISQLVRPRDLFVEEYLAKAVKAVGRGGDLAAAYRRSCDRLNLLRSREAVDKIMMGLVKIRREGWISDGEYIRLQEYLVENLGLISRP